MYLEFYVKNRDETSMKHFGLKIELKDCPYHQTNLERWIFLYFMNTKDFKNSFASTFVKYLKCKHHHIRTFSRAKYILCNGTSWWSTSTFIGNPMKKDGMTIKQIFSQKRQQNKLTKRHKNIFFSGRFLSNVNTKFAFIRPSSNRSFLLLFVCSITLSKTYSISFSLVHCSHNL